MSDTGRVKADPDNVVSLRVKDQSGGEVRAPAVACCALRRSARRRARLSSRLLRRGVRVPIRR